MSTTWQNQLRLAKTTAAELTCEGCGRSDAKTLYEFYEEGWDCPPWFFSHVTCPTCPITKTLWWELLQQSGRDKKSYKSSPENPTSRPLGEE